MQVLGENGNILQGNVKFNLKFSQKFLWEVQK